MKTEPNVTYTVEEMLTRPGVHAITTIELARRDSYSLVEVDAEGNCFQLNPVNQRDGELSREGWYLYTIAFLEKDLVGVIKALAAVPNH